MSIPEGPFQIHWKVETGGNRAVQPFYHLPVDVFLHHFEDTDEWAILVEQDWLDDRADDDGPDGAEYARMYVDGTHVDPSNVFDHPRIDRP